MIDTGQAVEKYDEKDVLISCRMRRKQKTGAYTQVDVVEAFSSLSSLLSLGLRVVREL
jgi:hypothetical protein